MNFWQENKQAKNTSAQFHNPRILMFTVSRYQIDGIWQINFDHAIFKSVIGSKKKNSNALERIGNVFRLRYSGLKSEVF